MALHSDSPSIKSSQVNWLFIPCVLPPLAEACCWSQSFFMSSELVRIKYSQFYCRPPWLWYQFPPRATKCRFAPWAVNTSVNIQASRDSSSGSSARSAFLLPVKWFFMFVLLAASICNGSFLIPGANGFLDRNKLTFSTLLSEVCPLLLRGSSWDCKASIWLWCRTAYGRGQGLLLWSYFIALLNVFLLKCS